MNSDNFDEFCDSLSGLSNSQLWAIYQALLLYFNTGETAELAPASQAMYEEFRQNIEQRWKGELG